MIDMDERPSLKQIRQDDQKNTASDVKQNSNNDSDLNKNNQLLTDWSYEAINPRNFTSNQNTGFLIDLLEKADPAYFFKLFLNDEVMNFLVKETDRYAEKVMKETTVKRNSRFKGWKPKKHWWNENVYWLAFTYGISQYITIKLLFVNQSLIQDLRLEQSNKYK